MDNVEKYLKPKRPQMKIWLLRVSYWMLKATNTHSEYLIRIVFPLQQRSHEAPQLCVIRTIVCLVVTSICTKLPRQQHSSCRPTCNSG